MLEQEELVAGRYEEMVENLVQMIQGVCDASMKICTGGEHYRPIYWWNSTLENLPKPCTGHIDMPREHAGGKTMMCTRNNIERHDKLCIRESRLVKGSLIELQNEVESNPWARLYKIVMVRLNGPRMCTANL